MSYLNPDELKPNEVDYIQYLYNKLHSELQDSISYIYELANQDNIRVSTNTPKIKPIIIKYLYNTNQREDVSNDGFIKFRTLIGKEVFKFFYDIIKPIPQEKYEEQQNKIYKKIIITDLYAFLPLITNLIIYYSTISEGLYKVCHEFILLKNINNTTNEMIIISLYSFKLSIALLHELLNFIKTRKTRDINKYLITPNKPKYDASTFNLDELQEIVLSFDIKKNNIPPSITINNYNKYLEDYIKESTATFIKVSDLEYKIANFIKYIELSLTTYLNFTLNINSNILKRLFHAINNIKNIDHNKLIELLKKIITSIEIINSILFIDNNYYTKKYRYKYILYGIYIIILLKKFIEYLYTKEYIIYAYIITIKELKNTDAFIAYINFKIYPNYKIYEIKELQNKKISIIDDITSFLGEQVKLDKQQKSNTSVIFTDPYKPETIKIFIADLKIYVLTFFQEILTDTNVNNNELKKIIYQNNTKTTISEILFIKNITSLFKIILYKISNKLKINDSIKYLLKYIIDLTINFCIILAKIGNVNKYLLKGIVNIILLNKLKDYFESDTTITYSYYNYRNIRIDISVDDVMRFIKDNNLDYDLNSNIIEFSKYMDNKDTYDNIDIIITKINYQYDYSDTNVTVFSGGSLNNKYKKTENKISVIYNKRKYTRVIYISERKKYIKLNKTYMLLSKFKKDLKKSI